VWQQRLFAKDEYKRPTTEKVPVALSALSSQRDMQITMLIEAVMLGYALARKGGRVS
jgi:hypothetical protein